MKFITPVLNVLKNKYFIAGVGFLIWMMFFDPKDLGLISARNKKLKELKVSEQHLTVLIKGTKKELLLLKTDAASIEKYAREKFFMKKDNVDLFIVNTLQ